jgi:acyl carrier protein
MAETQKKVIAIIAEMLGKPEDSINESSHFVDDLGADSLDLVEIIMAIEEAYGLEIPEGEQEKIKTVGHAVAYVEKNAKG